MTEAQIMSYCGQALFLILLLSAPMLISALVVGLIISILQATTQVQEQTLSFVPKIVATFLSLILFGPWISSLLGNFTVELIKEIPKIGLGAR